MKGLARDLSISVPRDLADALGQLAADPALRPLAGGTDLLVQHAAGSLGPAFLLDISRLPELGGIHLDGDWLVLGAGVCYADLQNHPLVLEHAPLLAQSASQTGARAIQERGTLGGNLANASPAADNVPALIAQRAELEILGPAGARRLPVDEFFLGYRQTALRAGELVTAILIPMRPDDCRWWRKVGTRRAQAISKLAFAAAGRWTADGLDCRLGWASLAAVPLRSREVEEWLARHAGEPGWKEEAVRRLRAGLRPIDDVRSTAAYRTLVAGNLLAAFLRRAEEVR